MTTTHHTEPTTGDQFYRCSAFGKGISNARTQRLIDGKFAALLS